jgi:hypothetical protein
MDCFAFRLSTSPQLPYVVLLHSAESPDIATWNHYVETLATFLTRSRSTVHVFAVTDGGGPDPGQRRALAGAFAPDRLGSTTHVFTTSTFTRGIVTAFHWLARSRAVAHRPEEFPSVCSQYLIPARAVLDDLQTLQKALPPVALLAHLERIVGSGASQVLRRSAQ